VIGCKDFCDWLTEAGVTFLTGVPDSVLKGFCAWLVERAADRHVLAANEGGAVALACGHHLATGELALVYMQNSGQGNAANPLVSLADPEVYGIPLLLLIGWRGEPGLHDEPQHVRQGEVTLPLMDSLGIPCRVLEAEPQAAAEQVAELARLARARSGPVALIVRKNTIEAYAPQHPPTGETHPLSREEALELVVGTLAEKDVIVSTTGKLSRELYELRERTGTGHDREFLTIGSMGHASQIAMGIARSRPERQVFCFDGDGALIMHLGAAAIIGGHQVPNLKHVVFNNGCHGSVGGMETVGFRVSFTEIARACGYRQALRAMSREEVLDGMARLHDSPGPGMLEIFLRKGARPDLGRPKTSPKQNKTAFMEFLSP